MHDIIQLFPVAGCPISKNNKQLIFVRNSTNDYLERYTTRENGYMYVTAADEKSEAVFTTTLLSSINNIGLNFKTDNTGYIKIEILDSNKKSLFIDKLQGDFIHKNIENIKLPEKFYIKFYLSKAKLFYVSFDNKINKIH